MTEAIAPSTPPRATSQARVDANRLNALKSTGPRTDDGKRAARANALKHGLAALKLRLGDDEEKVRLRADALAKALGAVGEAGRLLCEQAAAASAQAERAVALLAVAREAASIRAESPEAWALDRKVDNDKAMRSMPVRPSAVLAKLADSPGGVEYLIERWQMLRHDLGVGSGWTEVEVAMAMDLLDIPHDFRWLGVVEAYNQVHKPTLAAEPRPNAADAAEVCERMIDRLAAGWQAARQVDEVRREATVLGLSDEYAPEVRRMAKYEAAQHRRFRWSIELVERINRLAAQRAEAPIEDEANPPGAPIQNEANPPDAPIQDEANPPDAPIQNEANPPDAPIQNEANPPDAPIQDEANPPEVARPRLMAADGGPSLPAEASRKPRPDLDRMRGKARRRRRRA